MPGLDTAIFEHRLPLIPNTVPIRQQLRRMKPEVALKIKEEWNADFLAIVEYPQWLANIVPVPKKDGKVWMCVDYKDLNRASPKDNFPLPHIDMLVDNTTQHAFYSFMDGFSEDKEKTTFITTWGTLCYKVMSFELKNIGTTYQRVMVTLFHDMMHKEVEVYMDDMTAKSRTPNQHAAKLQAQAKPAKCTFGVKTGKLLRLIVNERGIGVDSDRIRSRPSRTC
ncbi:hypothetical protein CR513_45578, partial [Mucuna pruriens]